MWRDIYTTSSYRVGHISHNLIQNGIAIMVLAVMFARTKSGVLLGNNNSFFVNIHVIISRVYINEGCIGIASENC